LHEKAFAQAENRISAERVNSVAAVEIENLCGELRWICATLRCKFTLEDKSGLWLTIEVAPKDDAAAAVTVNGQKVEIRYGRLTKAIGFHLFLDASVSELICNEEHAITTRIYRLPYGPLLFRTDANLFTSANRFEAWQLKPISKDRLTS